MIDSGLEKEPHLGESELAAYLDRRLPAADRERIESHLAGCGECRADLIHTGRILSRLRQPRRLAVGSLIVLATAATLLLAVRTGLERPAPGARDTLMRGGPEVSAIVAYGPLGEVSPAKVRFVWAGQAGATTYRLTVTRSDGTTVWTRSAADTVMSLPDSISLRAGERYFWVADALLRDGATRSTGVRGFQLAQ